MKYYNERIDNIKQELIQNLEKFKVSIKKLETLEKDIEKKNFLNENEEDTYLKQILSQYSFCKIGGLKDLKNWDEYYDWQDRNFYDTSEKLYSDFISFDLKNFASKVLEFETCEKKVRLNVLYKTSCDLTDGREENPYFRDYQDCYIPVEAVLICGKDFDNKKLYSARQILNLIKQKKVILKECYDMKFNLNRNKLCKCKNINLNDEMVTVNGVNYKTKSLIIQTEDYDYDKLIETKLNNLSFPDIYNVEVYNRTREELVFKTINFYCKFIPDLKKFIIEEIKQSIPNQIKYLKQQANQEMINYKKSIDEIAKGIKRAQEQLKEQSQQVKNLKLNNILDNDFEM